MTVQLIQGIAHTDALCSRLAFHQDLCGTQAMVCSRSLGGYVRAALPPLEENPISVYNVDSSD